MRGALRALPLIACVLACSLACDGRDGAVGTDDRSPVSEPGSKARDASSSGRARDASDGSASETADEGGAGAQADAASGGTGGRPRVRPPRASEPAADGGEPTDLDEAGRLDAGVSSGGDASAGADGSALPGAGGAELLTQRYDNARTGANLAETTLNAANVPSLALLGTWLVEGEIYAQVLVASAVEVDGIPRAVAIVATMNNHVYEFDADASPGAALLWTAARWVSSAGRRSRHATSAVRTGSCRRR